MCVESCRRSEGCNTLGTVLVTTSVVTGVFLAVVGALVLSGHMGVTFGSSLVMPHNIALTTTIVGGVLVGAGFLAGVACKCYCSHSALSKAPPPVAEMPAL